MGANKKLKQEDIKQYVTEDLVGKIAEQEGALKKLEFTHAITTLENPASITAKRRDIARLKTELTKRKKENKA